MLLVQAPDIVLSGRILAEMYGYWSKCVDIGPGIWLLAKVTGCLDTG